jgi:uncharacterized protein YjiS (DUF1127 family)
MVKMRAQIPRAGRTNGGRGCFCDRCSENIHLCAPGHTRAPAFPVLLLAMMEVAMTIALRTTKRSFPGWRRAYVSADLKALSDWCLKDIGLKPTKREFEIVRPFWMA